MGHDLGWFILCVIVASMAFAVLGVLYQPRATLILYYVIGLICLSALVFLGDYGKVVVITGMLILLGQPLLADYLAYDFHTLQPNLRLSPKLGTSLSGLDEEIKVTTDDKGFRTSSPDAYAKRFKIFAIGGSTTEQIYLDDRKTTFALLERFLGADHAVINTGLSGLRAVNHIATLKQIRKYRPDAVIVLLGINDWNCAVMATCEHARSIFDPRGWPITLASRTVQEEMRERFSAKAPSPAQPPRTDAAASPLDYYARVMGQYPSKPKIALSDPAAYLSVFKLDLARLLSACESIPTTCVIVTQPTGYKAKNFQDLDYVRSLWMTPPNQSFALDEQSLIALSATFNDYIRGHAHCLHCKLFDLARLVDGDARYFYDDAHFNNVGASFFADELLAFLQREAIVPFSASERGRAPATLERSVLTHVPQ